MAQTMKYFQCNIDNFEELSYKLSYKLYGKKLDNMLDNMLDIQLYNHDQLYNTLKGKLYWKLKVQLSGQVCWRLHNL